MTVQVEEFIINLLNMGLSRGEANAKAYDYALALLIDDRREGAPVTAAMMAQAVELVKEAWTDRPLKYYLQEMKFAMREASL